MTFRQLFRTVAGVVVVLLVIGGVITLFGPAPKGKVCLMTSDGDRLCGADAAAWCELTQRAGRLDADRATIAACRHAIAET